MSIKKCLLIIGVVAVTLQAATYTTVLQNGTNGYTGCSDAFVDRARGIPMYTSTILTTSWN